MQTVKIEEVKKYIRGENFAQTKSEKVSENIKYGNTNKKNSMI